jgi:DNA-binding transcriptional ArsR family regulator
MLKTSEFDSVLKALADPTRRGLFERVAAAGEITVGELTSGSSVTQGAISQHLKALRQAGLVVERPEGRKVFYRANPQGLEPMIEWMTRYAVFWADRLSALDRLLREADARQKSPSHGDKE